MKRVDPKTAKDASPVEISRRILDALRDASESEGGEIILTLKKDLKGTGSTWCPGTGVRIEYGASNTFVEEPRGSMSDDTFTLTSVFKFLLKVLADREEAAENKARAAQQRESDALMERARAIAAHETEPAVEYVPREN